MKIKTYYPAIVLSDIHLGVGIFQDFGSNQLSQECKLRPFNFERRHH